MKKNNQLIIDAYDKIVKNPFHTNILLGDKHWVCTKSMIMAVICTHYSPRRQCIVKNKGVTNENPYKQ